MPLGALVYLVILTLKFDLLVKNFNFGCYLIMVAARRATLSSDNSYFVTISLYILHACSENVLSE